MCPRLGGPIDGRAEDEPSTDDREDHTTASSFEHHVSACVGCPLVISVRSSDRVDFEDLMTSLLQRTRPKKTNLQLECVSRCLLC